MRLSQVRATRPRSTPLASGRALAAVVALSGGLLLAGCQSPLDPTAAPARAAARLSAPDQAPGDSAAPGELGDVFVQSPIACAPGYRAVVTVSEPRPGFRVGRTACVPDGGASEDPSSELPGPIEAPLVANLLFRHAPPSLPIPRLPIGPLDPPIPLEHCDALTPGCGYPDLGGLKTVAAPDPSGA